MRHPEHHIFALTPDSLRQWCEERGLKPFRAAQILEWVYQKGVVDAAAMTNLSAADRSLLAREMTFLSGETLAHQRATDGTQKLLVEWGDAAGGAVGDPTTGSSLNVLGAAGDPSRQTECVMIPADGRRTACISSQVGCPVGCRFCASGLGGLDGNLSAGRIVEQVWRLSHHLDPGTPPLRGGRQGAQGHNEHASHPKTLAHSSQSASPSRISNVVFMGMGEPLANFEAVISAVRTIAAPWGLGISARKITISTVGLPKAIERLAERLELPVTLALSLHAPNDELRRRLIPWAEYTTIEDLLGACRAWFEKTGREITLEYILLGGVNDQAEHAHQLATVARTLRGNVNLIRYNEVEGLPFSRPETDDVHAFQAILREKGVNAHIRASRGRDIAAACGQLRHERATA